MTKNVFSIPTPQFFDWLIILSYLKRSPKEVMYVITKEDNVQRAFKIDSVIYICSISYDLKEQKLIISIINDIHPTKIALSAISDFIIDWFDINNRLENFYKIGQKDPILSSLVNKFSGLRLVGMPDFYEAITWGILGQQINISYTYTLKKYFIEKYGENIRYANKNYWIYPDPLVISQKSVEELMTLGISKRKAEYLQDISKRIAKKEISKKYYKSFDNAISAEKDMIKIRGIGPWTANYVLMRCIRMGDAFPTKDIGLLNGLKVLQKLDNKPNNKDIIKLRQLWGPWCSYATFYIWRLLY